MHSEEIRIKDLHIWKNLMVDLLEVAWATGWTLVGRTAERLNLNFPSWWSDGPV
jgi:hypothetical protein